MRAIATFNRSPNLFVALRREAGSNAIDIQAAHDPRDRAINRELLNPIGMESTPADDVVRRGLSAQTSGRTLSRALFATLVVRFPALPARHPGWGHGDSICIIVAFLGLLLAGRTINVISLAGIAFAIGMTLDNSIVVLKHRAGVPARCRPLPGGLRGYAAGVYGVASTMTTVLVFVPVAFVAQEAGQLCSTWQSPSRWPS